MASATSEANGGEAVCPSWHQWRRRPDQGDGGHGEGIDELAVLWNGSKLGATVTKFGVRVWPTVYVLDSQGIIRYKNVYRQTLDLAIDRLIAEAEAVRK